MRGFLILLAVAGCAGAPAHTTPWQRVPGGVTLYVYPETIERYAPDDRGGYLVRPRPGATAAERAALIAALDPPDPDDVQGDGVVLRLDDAERAQVAARPEVGAVEILQPAARRGPGGGDDVVRIDLFGGASDAERDAVAAWLEARGGAVQWRGPAALRATAPAAVAEELARLSSVRWVE